MSKFICLVLCIVAASLNNVHVHADAPTFRDSLKPILEACSKEYPVTTDEINKAVDAGDPNIVHPCFNGCVFKKAGFINKKGEYDTDSALTNLMKIVPNEEQYNKLAEVARQCTSVKDTVSDGEAGCERGARLSACFLQQKDKAGEDGNLTPGEAFDLLMSECSKKYGVNQTVMTAAVKAADASLIDPCFWGCYFRKTGLLNDKGQYDLNNHLSNFERFGWNDDDKKVAEICESVKDETVSDGEAGCEIGALLAACYMRNTP